MDATSIVPLGLDAPLFPNAALNLQRDNFVISDKLFKHLDDDLDVLNTALNGQTHQCLRELRCLLDEFFTNRMSQSPENAAHS